MISEALNLIKDCLNQQIKATLSLSGDVAIIRDAPTPHDDNRLLVFLVNVTEETFRRNASLPLGGNNSLGPGDSSWELYVMVAANFDGDAYDEGLKHLAHVLRIFQAKPLFNHQNTPGLDQSIDKIAIETLNLSLVDLNAVWGMHGGRYMPSVLYKLRGRMIDSGIQPIRQKM